MKCSIRFKNKDKITHAILSNSNSGLVKKTVIEKGIFDCDLNSFNRVRFEGDGLNTLAMPINEICQNYRYIKRHNYCSLYEQDKDYGLVIYKSFYDIKITKIIF